MFCGISQSREASTKQTCWLIGSDLFLRWRLGIILEDLGFWYRRGAEERMNEKDTYQDWEDLAMMYDLFDSMRVDFFD